MNILISSKVILMFQSETHICSEVKHYFEILNLEHCCITHLIRKLRLAVWMLPKFIIKIQFWMNWFENKLYRH